MPIQNQVDALPPAPVRGLGRQDYIQIADAFFSALETFRAQLVAQNTEVYAKDVEAIEAAQFIAQFSNRYRGAFASDPTTNLQLGDLYFRTTAPQEMRVYTSTGWVGVGSYTTGNINVTGFLKASAFLYNQSSFKNPPSANFLLNNFSSFIVDTNRSSQLNFSYNPSVPGAKDSFAFKLDLITRTGADVIFPTSVRWSDGGTSPTWNRPVFNSNARHLLKFYTSDSGTSWLGSVEVINASADNAPVIT